MLNYLVVDNLSTTIPGQIRDKKVIFNKFSDLYIVENQMVILRETGLIKSPIHYLDSRNILIVNRLREFL